MKFERGGDGVAATTVEDALGSLRGHSTNPRNGGASAAIRQLVAPILTTPWVELEPNERDDIIVCPFERRTTGSGWTGSGWTGYGGHGEDVAGRRWWCKGGARDKGRLWGKDWRGAGADDVSYDYPRRRRKTEGNADKRVRG